MFENEAYPTVEHAYQAAKTNDLELRKLIKNSKKPKQIGKTIKLRSDWDDIKFDIMYKLVLQKFSNSIILKNKLLDTGNAYLEETNYWGDTYWGVCKGEGLNNLGLILMRVRRKFQDERLPWAF